MAQIPSNVYSKTATYDFNLDGPIAPIGTGTNLGIVLNPGEFVIASWYKVLVPLVSAVPGVDQFGFTFQTDVANPPLYLVIGTATGFNTTLGFWVNCNQTTVVSTKLRQTLTPQGTPSNNFLMAFAAANTTTAGSIAFNCLIGSTALN